jgi:diguanylate cyclase (GGDEF)-like protein
MKDNMVLVELCKVISGRIRACDTFVRWGGEEFMILLPDSEYPNAVMLAEQVRSLIEETMLSCSNQVTCSFGVTELHVDDTLESLTGRVDDALYRAKKNGNRVEVIE